MLASFRVKPEWDRLKKRKKKSFRVPFQPDRARAFPKNSKNNIQKIKKRHSRLTRASAFPKKF